MGFRSILATEQTRFKISAEFREEYPWLNIPEESEDGFCYGAITSKREVKFYQPVAQQDVFVALQKQLPPDEKHYKPDIVVVLLHECGGITRVKITNDSITAREPIEWKEVEGVEHNYCYGCSDLKDNPPKNLI